MLELMRDLPDNIVGVVATGEVTAADYEAVLIPAVEAAIKAYGRIRVLYHVAPGFTGFTAGAMWDDATMGLSHFGSWEKAAVVTDVEWIRGATQAMGFLMPCPVRTFGDAALADAREWIAAA